MRLARIYCGLQRPDGQPVHGTDLPSFINASICSRFPAFTVQRVDGYWRGTSEPSVVIEIVYSSDSERAAIASIAAEYKRLFGRDAVLVVQGEVESSLV
jgi:hypothetical protein